MPSKYWEKRAIRIAHDRDKAERDLLNTLKTAYDDIIIDIRKSILDLYNTFGMDNNMSYEQSQRFLSRVEHTKWKKSIKEYQDAINAEKNPRRQAVLQLELNTLAMKTRLTRLEALEGEIKAHIYKLSVMEEKELRTSMSNLYKDTYYKWNYGAFKAGVPEALDMAVNNLVALDDKAVMAVLSIPWSGADYSKKIWHRNYNAADRLCSTITRHVQAGTDVRELIKEMTEQIKSVSEQNVTRLVQTELTYARGQADLQMYYDLDVKEYEYLATLDTKTSKTCQALDKKKFKIEDAKVGVNYPPMHPYCRSTTIPFMEREGKRAARDQKTGKTVSVDRNMNYKDWHDKYVESKGVVDIPKKQIDNLGANSKHVDIPKAVKCVYERLEEAPVNIRKKMQEHLTEKDVIIDVTIQNAYRYSVKRDEILINPDFVDFKSYDMVDALMHEGFHKIDMNEGYSVSSSDITKVIGEASKRVERNKKVIKELLEKEKYAKNIYFSDIVSALSNGDIEGWYGHSMDYWSKIGNKEKEIFANICSIYFSKEFEEISKIIDKWLPELKEILKYIK